MHKPKFKIGDTVYIKKDEIGSEWMFYSNTENSSSTKIIHMRSDTEYLYIVECSEQGWREHSLEFVKKPVKPLWIYRAYKILKLPTGYVFSKPVTFIPINLKETL